MFFHGSPARAVDVIAAGEVEACATAEIVAEYREVIARMIERHQGTYRPDDFDRLSAKLVSAEPVTHVEVCRDPDDDKFISCAMDSKAVYIVSGDKDLLMIGSYEGVEIITAAQFCERYL